MTNDDSSVPFLDPAGDYGGKNWEGVKGKVKEANNIAFQNFQNFPERFILALAKKCLELGGPSK